MSKSLNELLQKTAPATKASGTAGVDQKTKKKNTQDAINGFGSLESKLLNLQISNRKANIGKRNAPKLPNNVDRVHNTTFHTEDSQYVQDIKARIASRKKLTTTQKTNLPHTQTHLIRRGLKSAKGYSTVFNVKYTSS